MGKKKWRATLGLSVVGLLAVAGMWKYHLHLQAVVQPYAQSAPPPVSPAFAPLAAISQPMQDAVVATEDRLFYRHHGIDWAAARRAWTANREAGRIIKGGSTITQQLAKNLFLSSERTYRRKFKEALLAFEMEHMLSKQRILELYLNAIDYGMGQRGIVAAAQYYFHKKPGELTLSESAMLAGLLRHPPRKLNPSSLAQLDEDRKLALSRVESWWQQRYSHAEMEQAGRIPLSELIVGNKTGGSRSNLSKQSTEREEANRSPTRVDSSLRSE